MAGGSTKGSTPVQLKPTTLVRCGSKRCQTENKAAVDDLAYLRAFSHGTVHVGTRAPRPAGREEENSAFVGAENGSLVIDQLCSNSSACGLRLRIVSSTELGIFSTQSFTIGGFVIVNDKLYGLTTAHSLFPDEFADEETNSCSEDSSDRSVESEEWDTEYRRTSEDSVSPPEKRTCRGGGHSKDRNNWDA